MIDWVLVVVFDPLDFVVNSVVVVIDCVVGSLVVESVVADSSVFVVSIVVVVAGHSKNSLRFC